MILGLSESQDAILLYILFSDYYLIYLFFDRPIFSKYQNIGTVFLPTVRLVLLFDGLTLSPRFTNAHVFAIVLCHE